MYTRILSAPLNLLGDLSFSEVSFIRGFTVECFTVECSGLIPAAVACSSTVLLDVTIPYCSAQVRIDPNFTSMMMAIMVIEGLGRSLDPELDILSHAQPCVLKRVKQSVRQVVASRLREITA